MCGELVKSRLYDAKKSNHLACHIMRQHEFLTQVLETVESSETTVISALERLRQKRKLLQPKFECAVFCAENIRVHVSGSILDLPNPLQPWLMLTQNLGAKTTAPKPFLSSKHVLSALGKQPCKSVFIAPMPAIESQLGTQWAH
jgi:hypothetical protein